MPWITFPFREGVIQVCRVNNKNTTLPETLSGSRRVNIKDGVPDIPRPARTATNQDRLGEYRIENCDETVQVFKEAIRQVLHYVVLPREEVIERPDSNKHTALPTSGREVLNPFEQVTKLAAAMCHLSQDLVKLDCSQIVRDFRRSGRLLDPRRLVRLGRKSRIRPNHIGNSRD